MRRYELMLVLRPDLADERSQAILERSTRTVVGAGGQLVKVSPWGRRRLAYPIDGQREGSYHLIVFDAPAEAVLELERSLHITEEVMRHLVTRIERPVAARRPSEGGSEAGADSSFDGPPEDEAEPDREVIDESESEAAPAATD